MEFVHVCGLSAVGKRTLIHKLVASPAIAERFEIGQPIELFGPVDYPTGGPARPAGELLQAQVAFNLHKWQFVTHDILVAVREAFPSSTHRIVLIWRPFEQNRDAILKRNTPEEKNPWSPTAVDLERQWHESIVPRFRDLRTLGFHVEIVDGSQPEYPVISPAIVGL